MELNKGFKKVAITWGLSGIFMFLSATINLLNRKSPIAILICYIASMMLFVNSHDNYKRSKRYKKDDNVIENKIR